MVVNLFWLLLLDVKNEKHNIIKEKYILVKRRQNTVETDRGSYYNKEDG